MKRKYMESMKQKFFRAAVPLVMLAVSAALSVFVYRLPQPVRDPLPVLMYHHMVPDGQDCNDMTVTPGKFRADLETVLAMGYTPVLPRELAAGDALPEKPILITFDDGYRSNYDLVYPILREYGVKACISIIVLMPDLPTDNFCTWNQLREMTASGLVEIGSHSYRLHNLGGDSGNFESGGANGVERRPNESDADFQTRVLDDIQLSHDRIAGELGGVTCFAYPFGCSDPDAKALVDELFPVTLMTTPKCADLAKGLHDLPRAVQAIHGLPALKFLALQMEPGDLRRHNVHLVGHIADGALQGTDAAFKQRRAVLGDTEGAQRLPLQDPAVLPYAQQSVLLIQKQGTVPLVGAEAVCGLERRLQSLILLKRGGVRLRFC